MADEPPPDYSSRDYSPFQPGLSWQTAAGTMPYLIGELRRLRACLCATPAAAIPQAAAPVFNPISGAYELPFVISLTTTTETGVIHYTLDGSDPNIESLIFDPLNPITITQDTLIRAITIAPGYTNSDISEATYTIEFPQAATPLFSPAPGDYPTTVVVTLTSPNGGQMFYTLGGSLPTPASTPYAGPITVLDDTTIRAIAVVPGFTNSDPATGVYTVTPLIVADPVYAPTSGTFTGSVSVTITSATPGALVYYTTDGSVPDESDFLAAGAIVISATTNFKARAFRAGYTTSNTVPKTYTINTLVWTFWGRSFNPTIDASEPNNGPIAIRSQTTNNYLTTTSDYNVDVINLDTGPYVYYGVQSEAADPAAAPDGFALNLPIAPASLAQADEGYTLTDSNGWPYYILALTFAQTGLPDGNYRVYRFKNQLNGAFTFHVAQ